MVLGMEVWTAKNSYGFKYLKLDLCDLIKMYVW